MFPVLSTQNEKAPVCLLHWDMGEASSPLRLLGSLETQMPAEGSRAESYPQSGQSLRQVGDGEGLAAPL